MNTALQLRLGILWIVHQRILIDARLQILLWSP